MSLILEANYSKKLGLPGYSSHQYSVTVRTELSGANQVEEESKRLYGLLQSCVDREIQNTGFLPGSPAHANGTPNGCAHGNGYPHPNGYPNGRVNGHGHAHGAAEAWKCTPKQRELILKLVEDRHLSKTEVEQLSQKLFSLGVRSLNKLQASGLIGQLNALEPGPAPARRSLQPIPMAGGRR